MIVIFLILFMNGKYVVLRWYQKKDMFILPFVVDSKRIQVIL
jgi:hypothetical protein